MDFKLLPGKAWGVEGIVSFIGEEVLGAIAVGELRPRADEDMEVAGRLVGVDRDRILLLECLERRGMRI